MIICDTGPLVTAADRGDADNRACTDLFTGLHLARRPILVPAPVVAEVGYLLARTGGPRIESAFLRSIAQQTIIVDLELADYERLADLVDTYADFPSAPPTPPSSRLPKGCGSAKPRPATTATSASSARGTLRRSLCSRSSGAFRIRLVHGSR